MSEDGSSPISKPADDHDGDAAKAESATAAEEQTPVAAAPPSGATSCSARVAFRKSCTRAVLGEPATASEIWSPTTCESDLSSAGPPSQSDAASVGRPSVTGRPSLTEGLVVPQKKGRRRKSTHFAEQIEEVLPVVMEGGTLAAQGRRRSSRRGSVPIAQQVMAPSHKNQLSVFDDYDFLEEKGGGAFGRVMQVQHKEAGFVRACKSVAIRSRRHFSAVETEVALMRRLDHPNVLRLFESYYDGDRNIYLVIELCTGGSLAQRLQKCSPAPMPEAQAAHMARELFSAVQYCHRHGVVHRDLKPDNVLYSHGGADASLKVIDFGLSDFRARLARMETVGNTFGGQAKPLTCVGTAHYMAPEIYNSNIYDEKVDVFACGVILAEALTAVHPFFVIGKDDLQSIREKIVHGAVDWTGPHWNKVDPRAKDLTRKLLHLKREERLTASAVLQHPWMVSTWELATAGDENLLSKEIFQSLERFSRWHVLGQAASRVLVRQLDAELMAVPRADFRLLDVNADGVISAEELLEGSRRCGAGLEADDIADMMEIFDRTGGVRRSLAGSVAAVHEISWTDFQAAMIFRGGVPTTEQFMYVFKRFAGNAEAITPHSLQESLSSCLFCLDTHEVSAADYVPASNDGEVVSKEELDRVFAEIGTHTSLQGLGAAERSIDFKHFRAMLRRENVDRKPTY